MKMLARWILAVLLSTTCAVSAAPTAEQAKELVGRIIGWSLTGDSHQNPVRWDVTKQHKGDFQPDFYALMEWVSTPHPDAEGRPWHYEVNPLWQLQMGSVGPLRVGTPKAEGELQLVVVDYQVPSARESQPPSKFHNTWVVAEVDGKAVLKDIRYHAKHSTGVLDGSVAAEMKKAKDQFKAP